MTLRWADELSCSEPLPQLEGFYTLAALEVGDPDGEQRWLEKNAAKFHELYRTYRREVTECGRNNTMNLPKDSAEVLVQYLVWYPRESARLFPGKAE